eukprot:Gregarina_sp_Poly_1__774@NODE_1185_length_4838_cov_96_099350_g815_i0_p1_GENE_NODE_1185_length_4838_cov_96_099350_g815_i0NODE_1185_length_4838_cov_96_099350_g815_i0_p1_ORF_typecomplete_len1109_score209_22Mcp5_PH/PF12814_7/1_2e04Mcp5_PH/PF12814_7/4_6e06PH_12/PF16457_5/9_9e03PH_12/PF16457_5/3_3e05PH/PF00169_29/0_0011_NODE_1185_length_4838_cov_96_099350_g815_i014424768
MSRDLPEWRHEEWESNEFSAAIANVQARPLDMREFSKSNNNTSTSQPATQTTMQDTADADTGWMSKPALAHSNSNETVAIDSTTKEAQVLAAATTQIEREDIAPATSSRTELNSVEDRSAPPQTKGELGVPEPELTVQALKAANYNHPQISGNHIQTMDASKQLLVDLSQRKKIPSTQPRDTNQISEMPSLVKTPSPKDHHGGVASGSTPKGLPTSGLAASGPAFLSLSQLPLASLAPGPSGSLSQKTLCGDLCLDGPLDFQSESGCAATTPLCPKRESGDFSSPLTVPIPRLEYGSSPVRENNMLTSPAMGTAGVSSSDGKGQASDLNTAARSRISRIDEAFHENKFYSAPPPNDSAPDDGATLTFKFPLHGPLVDSMSRTPSPSLPGTGTEEVPDFDLAQLSFHTPASVMPKTSMNALQKAANQALKEPGLNQDQLAPIVQDSPSLLGELIDQPFSTPNLLQSQQTEPVSQPLVSVSQATPNRTPNGSGTPPSSPVKQTHVSNSPLKKTSPAGSRGRTNLLCSDDEGSSSISDGEERQEDETQAPVLGVTPRWVDFPEAHDVRPTADVSEEFLDEHDKRTIYVLYKGEINIVSWMEQTPARDVREAILCACDAIADTGFLLRELISLERTELDQMLKNNEHEIGGQLILVECNDKQVYYKRGPVYEFEDFHQLEGNKIYYLELSREREDLKQITGDRWRRLKIPINPFQHVEAQKAIRRMRLGTNLLKHTSYGFPHLRHFQLSPDLKRLIWYSAGKSKDQTIIHLANVTQIKIGFEGNPRQSGLPQVYTFTLMAGRDGTFQLAAKDEEEYDLWVAGLKALACWAHGRLINKVQLLSHSRRFRQALERQDLSARIDDKTNTTAFSLINAIKLPTLGRSDLLKKESRLRSRLRQAREKMKLIDADALGALKDPDAADSQEASAFGAAVFSDPLSDEQMEYNKMEELIEVVDKVLADARSQLEACNIKPLDGDSPSTELKDQLSIQTDENRSPSERVKAPCAAVKKEEILRNVTKLLWKAEVDTENIEDIYKRLTESPSVSFQKILGDVNNNLLTLTKNFTSWVQTRSTSVLPMLFSGTDPATTLQSPTTEQRIEESSATEKSEKPDAC